MENKPCLTLFVHTSEHVDCSYQCIDRAISSYGYGKEHLESIDEQTYTEHLSTKDITLSEDEVCRLAKLNQGEIEKYLISRFKLSSAIGVHNDVNSDVYRAIHKSARAIKEQK